MPQARPAHVSVALEILKYQMINSQISLNTITGQGVVSFRHPSYSIIHFTRYYDCFLSLVLYLTIERNLE